MGPLLPDSEKPGSPRPQYIGLSPEPPLFVCRRSPLTAAHPRRCPFPPAGASVHQAVPPAMPPSPTWLLTPPPGAASVPPRALPFLTGSDLHTPLNPRTQPQPCVLLSPTWWSNDSRPKAFKQEKGKGEEETQNTFLSEKTYELIRFQGKFVHTKKRIWVCPRQEGPQWLLLGDPTHVCFLFSFCFCLSQFSFVLLSLLFFFRRGGQWAYFIFGVRRITGNFIFKINYYFLLWYNWLTTLY